MPFDSGSLSFRRFAVVGAQPSSITEELLTQLSDHALHPSEFASEEHEVGFCGGRHILDAEFSFANNVFADRLYFALRIDTNKVPSELKRAYQLQEEESYAKSNPSGFLSKRQKREARETARRKIEEDLRTGRFRKSKLIPILWDIQNSTLYCLATGKNFELLADLFERALSLSLEPITSGSLALRLLEPKGKRRDYEDFRPTRFVTSIEGESTYPDYPWIIKGPEPKDFLGNEFLLWLWHESERREADIDMTVMIDRSLDLDCAYGITGKASLRSTAPARMLESRDALRTGKLPRKAGIILDIRNQQFTFTFNPESFTLTALKLPNVEEADNPRVLFEERIALLRDLCRSLDDLYDLFLKTRASSAWESQTGSIRRWILQTPKPIAAVA